MNYTETTVNPSMNAAESLIRAALPEVMALMKEAYDRSGLLAADHPLSQEGLRNGHEIVLDYLDHNEPGVAYEHLLYMISEPPLLISEECFDLIVSAGKALRFAPEVWDVVRRRCASAAPQT
jgi:hypothetical protein